MGVWESDDVGSCSVDWDFRAILVEACRSESDDVGVGWGKDWGQIGGGCQYLCKCAGTIPPGAVMVIVWLERKRFLPQNLADTV